MTRHTKLSLALPPVRSLDPFLLFVAMVGSREFQRHTRIYIFYHWVFSS